MELVALADHLRPYRSVAAWYCWRASDWARAGNPA
jgi:3-methyladenine DNA glycosylase/8-oxoguanine DNA glycosylase